MISIDNAILHVFDFEEGTKHLSESELDLTEKLTKSYVQRRLRACVNSPENKHGQFAEDSGFAEELRVYLSRQIDFVSLSTEIAQFFWEELRKADDLAQCDLLVADFTMTPEAGDRPEPADEEGATAPDAFDSRPERKFAVVLLPRRQSFMHSVEHFSGQDSNEIVRHDATLPNPGGKIDTYAVVDLTTFSIDFQDKPRTIAEAEVLLLTNGFLRCSAEASSKEVLETVSRVVEEIAEEYGKNPARTVSRAKACIAESADLDETVDPERIGRQVFKDEPQLVERYEEAIEREQLPEQVSVRRGVANRLTKNHKIRTDTGIDITFPSEYSLDSTYIEFVNEEDGHLSIMIKNVGTIENR